MGGLFGQLLQLFRWIAKELFTDAVFTGALEELGLEEKYGKFLAQLLRVILAAVTLVTGLGQIPPYLAIPLAVVAFWGAGKALETLGTWFRARRPDVLRLRLDPVNVPACKNSFRSEADGQEYTQLRIRATTSAHIIRNCSGKLHQVQRLDASAPPYTHNIPLSWDQPEPHKVDLRKGQFTNLSVILMRDGYAQIERSPKNHYRVSPFDGQGDYEVIVRVFSDDSEAKQVRFTFHWTGEVATSFVSDVTIGKVTDGAG